MCSRCSASFICLRAGAQSGDPALQPHSGPPALRVLTCASFSKPLQCCKSPLPFVPLKPTSTQRAYLRPLFPAPAVLRWTGSFASPGISPPQCTDSPSVNTARLPWPAIRAILHATLFTLRAAGTHNLVFVGLQTLKHHVRLQGNRQARADQLAQESMQLPPRS